MKSTTWMLLPCIMLIAASASAAERPTYTKDVAPILFANCVSCHRSGEIAPMSLMNYDEVRPWAKSIKKAISEGTMPPWHADSSKVEYLNDLSLSSAERETILGWVDSGATRGDAGDMPEAPTFTGGWAMGEPDFIFPTTTGFTVEQGETEIEYQSVYFDSSSITEDLYITEWEIRPTHLKSVHHANMVRAPKALDRVGIGQAVLAGGDYIGSYLPGCRPMKYPEGTALRIPAGSVIQIQIHYVGLEDRDVVDHTELGVKFAQGRVDKIMRVLGTDDNDMEIAPYQDDYTLETSVNLLYDLTILSSGAHMHTRGDSYLMKAILPDGGEKLIADVPNYDFNWQSNYQLANPVQVPKGTELFVKAGWDNSAKNPNNPDPSQKVVYGPWTKDEMLVTWAHAVLTNEKLGLKLVDGRLVGKFDDAQEAPHPFLLQSLPASMRPREPKAETVGGGL